MLLLLLFGFLAVCNTQNGHRSNASSISHVDTNGAIGSIGHAHVSIDDVAVPRLVGYYDARASQRACHKMEIDDIDTKLLTHLNLAYASIDLHTLRLVPMDGSTSLQLFQQFPEIKYQQNSNPMLEVFISIGGSDVGDSNNNTSQATLSYIASDPHRRDTFSRNLLHFVTEYGYNGVDIDWKYPSIEEKENFVQLVEAIRTAQRESQDALGLSVVVPSSTFHLAAFDIPALSNSSDWFNIEAFHSQDANSGDYATLTNANLIDLELSIDSLTKNAVPPAKINLLLELSGKTYVHENEAVRPGEPGNCTGLAGHLARFEISAYIHRNDDERQVVQYDNLTSLAAKVDFAVAKRLGGISVNSIDQESTTGTSLAHITQHLGIDHLLHKRQLSGAGHWMSQNGQQCLTSECVSNGQWHPPSGYGLAPGRSSFKDNCKSGFKRHIYCPLNAMPQTCTWRGGDAPWKCYAQCNSGEISLAQSQLGDAFCINPGKRAFCCKSNEWLELIDHCEWSSLKPCGECRPGHYPVEGVFKKEWATAFRQCKQRMCCVYPFQGCGWGGKGEKCKGGNTCKSTQIELSRNLVLNSGKYCINENQASHRRPLCCDAPLNLNPFLPAPLEDLFPQKVSYNGLPAYDYQILSQGLSKDKQTNVPETFFLLVIDGQKEDVASLNKRDGSHIEFVSKGIQRVGNNGSTHTARFVCTDLTKSSNCDDIHLNGLDGTIVRMPDDMGFAKYAVAHAVRNVSTSIDYLPNYIQKRFPPNAYLQELEFSYNFSRIKRSSRSITARVDYASSYEYFKTIVQSPHNTRSLKTRDWATNSMDWRKLLDKYRTDLPERSGRLLRQDFESLLISDNGPLEPCSNNDEAYMRMEIRGSATDTPQWGTTIIWEMAPELKVKQSVAFLNAKPFISGTLDVDGRGYYNFNDTRPRAIFDRPQEKYHAGHPGIIEISPRLQAYVALAGKGEINGKFSNEFRTVTNKPFNVNSPPEVGENGGAILSTHYGQLFEGTIAMNPGRPKDNMTVEISVQSELYTKLYSFGSEDTSESFLGVNVPHAVSIVNHVDGYGSEVGVIDTAIQPVIEASDGGAGTIRGYNSDAPADIGDASTEFLVWHGNKEPTTPRKRPEMENGAMFNDLRLIGCSLSAIAKPVPNCMIASNATFDLESNNESNSLLRRSSEIFSRTWNSGSKNPKGVQRPNGEGEAAFDEFDQPFATYPNGGNGEDLNYENGREYEYFGFESLGDCDNWNFITRLEPSEWNQQQLFAQRGGSGQSDHVFDLAAWIEILKYAMGAAFEDGDGHIDLLTPYPAVPFDEMRRIYSQPYVDWSWAEFIPVPPTFPTSHDLGATQSHVLRHHFQSENEREWERWSVAGAIAHELGSSYNPASMVNVQSSINAMKGRILTLADDPLTDTDLLEVLAKVLKMKRDNMSPDQTALYEHRFTETDRFLTIVRNIIGVFWYFGADLDLSAQIRTDLGMHRLSDDYRNRRRLPYRILCSIIKRVGEAAEQFDIQRVRTARIKDTFVQGYLSTQVRSAWDRWFRRVEVWVDQDIRETLGLLGSAWGGVAQIPLADVEDEETMANRNYAIRVMRFVDNVNNILKGLEPRDGGPSLRIPRDGFPTYADTPPPGPRLGQAGPSDWQTRRRPTRNENEMDVDDEEAEYKDPTAGRM